MQHIHIKLFAETPVEANLAGAIAVFHRWIQTNAVPGLLIDVADYAHVGNGPGVVLIGHEANYSLDMSRGRLGLLYQRKAPIEGQPAATLRAALDITRAAAARLEQEPEFAGRLRLGSSPVAIVLNDRLLYPNSPETFEMLKPVFEEVLPGHTLVHNSDPRERFELLATRV